MIILFGITCLLLRLTTTAILFSFSIVVLFTPCFSSLLLSFASIFSNILLHHICAIVCGFFIFICSCIHCRLLSIIALILLHVFFSRVFLKARIVFSYFYPSFSLFFNDLYLFFLFFFFSFASYSATIAYTICAVVNLFSFHLCFSNLTLFCEFIHFLERFILCPISWKDLFWLPFFRNLYFKFSSLEIFMLRTVSCKSLSWVLFLANLYHGSCFLKIFILSLVSCKSLF